jgi:hypothetical protein
MMRMAPRKIYIATIYNIHGEGKPQRFNGAQQAIDHVEQVLHEHVNDTAVIVEATEFRMVEE